VVDTVVEGASPLCTMSAIENKYQTGMWTQTYLSHFNAVSSWTA